MDNSFPSRAAAPPPGVAVLADESVAYDYLLAGGGAAGLSLAYHLLQEPRLAGCRLLLVELQPKTQNDRTWSYWADAPGPFDHLARASWQRLAFRAPGFERVLQLRSYRYYTIRGLDFYRFVQQALAAAGGRVTQVRGEVAELRETAAGVEAVLADGRRYRARYAFDSRPPAVARRPDRHRYLLQHFVGWEVETARDAFDPEVVEFMDFRGPQHREARFMYVLPYGPRRALVEYTLFSGQLLPRAEYEAHLTAYLQDRGLRPADYRVVEVEAGAIPMSDHPLPARASRRILNLGTRAGRAKPSTGYAFRRIQQQSARLARALAETGQPPADTTGDKWQFRLFDTLLLDIMQRRGERTRDIFRQLFAGNPVERILRFLDERTSWQDNLRVMNSVAAGPFLRSIWQVLRRRVGRR